MSRVPNTWISISLEYFTDSVLTADSNMKKLFIDQDNHIGEVMIVTNICFSQQINKSESFLISPTVVKMKNMLCL